MSTVGKNHVGGQRGVRKEGKRESGWPLYAEIKEIIGSAITREGYRSSRTTWGGGE